MNVYLVSSEQLGDYFNYLVMAADPEAAVDQIMPEAEEYIEDWDLRGQKLRFDVDLVLSPGSPTGYLGDDERGVRETAEVLTSVVR